MPSRRGRPLRILAFGLAILTVAAAFGYLGTWQLQRRAWKHALVARVEQRIHAEPAPPPARADWPGLTAETAEYRRLRLQGRFLPEAATRVDALTARGAGDWLLVPLLLEDGSTVLINRGFVPAGTPAAIETPPPPAPPLATVTGLLRLSEPGGRVLRANDPAANRWFSRDVAAIGAARGLHDLAPYFVDADATPNPGGLPVGGLTVTDFPDSHLVYALTWYGLCLMSLGGGALLLREERRRARPSEA